MLPAVEKPRDQVAILIEGKVREMPSFWSDCCIYKVPERFREGNEEFYKPSVFSIGPYHFHQGSFPQMQIFKLKYLEAFLSPNHLSLDQCLGLVRTWEGTARRYYADPIDLSSDEFAELMLVDAIFVLELLLRCMIFDVVHDVMLIENQIPFFVLEGLYDLVDSNSTGNLKLVELTHEFLKCNAKIDAFGADHAPVPGVDHGLYHFVDFIRYYYVPPPPREDSSWGVTTSKDVDLLTEHEIISSLLEINDELSALIKRIGQGVYIDGRTDYYLSLSENLSAYCKVPWHKWKANLKRDYFNTPWKLASTIAAIILLVLTLIQTICSILSV
ncbi:PREDICTED: UPF0481 protein At3g47200-like [Prunus mume]|uniref:UPF0481 protein At3g47200-like n=1 Tax=Prunus mume TaxID=102107 RepID=A0ABM1LXE8_PRUMU|nr:PREDICTED: UPF0481 protein At3g47200-like [Prunus mume]